MTWLIWLVSLYVIFGCGVLLGIWCFTVGANDEQLTFLDWSLAIVAWPYIWWQLRPGRGEGEE